MTVSRRLPAALLVLALASAPLLLAQPARADGMEPTPSQATISLSGTGRITAAADLAVVTSGVVSEARTASDALVANSRAMNNVISAIRHAGIAGKDIQTSGFSVSPRYSNRPARELELDSPEIVGYRVNNGLTIRVRDLASLGTLLDGMVTNGANSIGGISFVVSNADEKLDAARTMAIEDARRKAELYAAAANASLGRIRTISETNGYSPAPRAMAMKAMEAAPVPVEVGEETLSVSVHVEWELMQ
ncbi:SIMPL domain-containing protein [Breoghania sp. L-A4]|uniref:SIMPL domain-containing protein n=1 Tax=Breoghania sp. L-A4 TaxID=2304600 RepID=UPI000E360879|nr:SIMPL domain-containing protein [Breoghania sp. L-A4]AXS41422.1 DUF541 domain-containing protein [Breoghania sp. L-A4]